MGCDQITCCERNAQKTRETPNPTIREVLDEQIEISRKHTEKLCIAKAKAETCGLLDYPHRAIYEMLGNVY
jgi:hypothetical protein